MSFHSRGGDFLCILVKMIIDLDFVSCPPWRRILSSFMLILGRSSPTLSPDAVWRIVQTVVVSPLTTSSLFVDFVK